jgi:hypothetical protein
MTARIPYRTSRGIGVSGPYGHVPGSPIFQFPLPTGAIAKMRIAPPTDQGSVTFSDAQIVDRSGKLIRQFDLTNLCLGEEPEQCTTQDNQIIICTTPHPTLPGFDTVHPDALHLEN